MKNSSITLFQCLNRATDELTIEKELKSNLSFVRIIVSFHNQKMSDLVKSMKPWIHVSN